MSSVPMTTGRKRTEVLSGRSVVLVELPVVVLTVHGSQMRVVAHLRVSNEERNASQ